MGCEGERRKDVYIWASEDEFIRGKPERGARQHRTPRFPAASGPPVACFRALVSCMSDGAC